MENRFKVIFKFIICILSSLYLTCLVAQKSLTTKLQVVFVFSYFIIICFSIYCFYEKFIKNKLNIKYRIITLLISIILSILTLLTSSNTLYPKILLENGITIISLGDKNIKSEGVEIWITGISIDNNFLELSDIPLTEGWEYKLDSNVIFTNSSIDNQSLLLNLPKGEIIKISFVMHNWSGMVSISNMKESTTLDLYNKEGSEYIYEVKGNQFDIPFYLEGIIPLSIGVIVSSLIYLVLSLIKVKRL